MKKEKKVASYNADDDNSEASPTHSADELSDGIIHFFIMYLFLTELIGENTEGVGTPYNVAHNFHVEFHADLGFTVCCMLSSFFNFFFSISN